MLHEKRGDVRAAVEQYERAVELEPEILQGPVQPRPALRLEWATWSGPGSCWEAFLESNPAFVQGHYYLAKLLMDTGGDLARAEKLAREGIALDPEHAEGPLGYYVLADLLNRTGRTAEAREAAAKGREIQAAAK